MHVSAPDALQRAQRIRLMVFDVDGVLTDGRLWYGPRGEELKAFHAFDGHGLKMLAASGVPCALLSGCLLYTSPSPRDKRQSRMPSSA